MEEKITRYQRFYRTHKEDPDWLAKERAKKRAYYARNQERLRQANIVYRETQKLKRSGTETLV